MISGNSPPISCGIGDYTANLLAAMHGLSDSPASTWLSRKERWFNSPMGRCRGIPLVRPWHKWGRRGSAFANAYLKWKKPDLIHLQEEFYSYMEGNASLKLTQSAQCPLVVTLHAYHLDSRIERHTKQILKRADRVICSDRRTAHRLQENTGFHADLIGWCSSPVRPQVLADEKKAKRQSFATFGFVHPGKMNFSVVNEAIKRTKTKGEVIEWKIIGPINPNENPSHVKLLQELNDPWVHFTGRVKNLNDASFHRQLSELTAMLLPFRNKTGSNGTAPSRSSLQIAWAFGLPVVTSSPIEDEPELRDGENCLLVDEDDANAWQAALERIINDQCLREHLRQGSLDSAKHFSWDRLAMEHIGVYNDIINGK